MQLSYLHLFLLYEVALSHCRLQLKSAVNKSEQCQILSLMRTNVYLSNKSRGSCRATHTS